jgi:hypothetical protein
MAVVAPFARYKKTNLKIYIGLLLIFAVYFYYDGHYGKKFIAKHTVNGKPDSSLIFNRTSPPYLFAAAVAIAVYAWTVRNKKIVADDQKLIISENEKISYTSIQSVNKSSYDSKGFFIVDYKDDSGSLQHKIISTRTYDNLDAVLELLVSKITG